MKKFLLAILLLFSVVTLVACEDKPDPKPPATDTVKPVITVPGAEVEVYVGDEFDPMTNVTATDDKDGNITNKITHTSNPALDLTKAGRYTITYKVKDTAGNEGTKDVVVIVKERPQGLGIENTNFAEWDEERGLPVGWNSWVNESQGVAATFSHVDGEVVVDITQQSTGENNRDNNWWDVQFKCNTVTFPAFESYTLRIWAYAEHERYMMVQIQKGGLEPKAIDSKLVELGTTVPTEPIEIDFFGLQDANNAELQFSLGTFFKVADTHADKQTVLGKVYFVKIEIVSGPEIENQAPMLKGSDIFVPIGGQVLIKQGIIVKDDRDKLTLENVTATPVGGVALDVNVPGTYEYEYSVTDSEEMKTTMRRKFIVGSFIIPTMDKWTAWTGDGGEQTVTAPAGSTEAQIKVTTLGKYAWSNQFKLTKLMGTKGTYRIKFTASSTPARTILFALEENYGVGVPKVWHRLDLTPDAQTFKFDLTLPANATSPGQFQFFMGNFKDHKVVVEKEDTFPYKDGIFVPSTIVIKDFAVREVLPEAGLKNGNFAEWDAEKGVPKGWNKWVNTGQDVVAEYSHVYGKTMINITQQPASDDDELDNNWWDVQLKYEHLVFDAYESYTLKIWAYAESPRYMRINLGGGGLPERPINELQVELGTKVPTKPIEINFFGKTDAVNATVTFHFGTFYKVPGVPEDMKTVLGKVYIQKIEIAPGPELVNQPPTIQGGPIVTDKGVAIDIKKGIKVQDDMDIVKLDNVVATPVDPAKPLDINTPGAYPYKYKITDSEGESAELTRTIYVGSFVVPTMDKWTQWADGEHGAVQTVTAPAGSTEASINVTGLADVAWRNQFKLTNVIGTKGTYQIKFKAKASVARSIIFALEQSYGVGVPRTWSKIDLTTEFAEFIFTLKLPEDAKETGALAFFLGDASTEKVVVDGVDTFPFAGGTYIPAVITIKDFTVTKIS
ncbi:MAG: immunoglobulin-like domain-containing protein [Acholeplasmataceae bacterium]|jgi:hypothetical protein